MKIGIDARVMYPEASGIGRYSIEIVKAIAAHPEAKNHEFILYPSAKTNRLNLPDNWKYSDKKIPSRGITRALLYPFIIIGDNIDIFYSTDYLGPLLRMPCKTVVIVYDLIPYINPDFVSLNHRFTGRYLLKFCVKNATAVISISQTTKKDILKYIKVPHDKIRTIYLGKNSLFHPRNRKSKELHKIQKVYGIEDRPYIIFLGYNDPRKNIPNIMKAFADIDETVKSNSVLVIAGNINSKDSVLIDQIKKHNLEDNIIFTGFIQDDDLAYLFSGARAFCFPSLYEGFGLPVLEAMACGCPVITSNTSSLPEVAGDAALLVDPEDTQDISEAMTRLLTDDGLFNDLSVKSIVQSKKFSWEKASKEVMQIFNTI